MVNGKLIQFFNKFDPSYVFVCNFRCKFARQFLKNINNFWLLHRVLIRKVQPDPVQMRCNFSVNGGEINVLRLDCRRFVFE